MKLSILSVWVIFFVSIVGCSTEPACANSDIENFDSFLGVQYGANELELEAKIGRFTGGEYAADSSAFIYYFKRVKNAPVTVWVNAATGKVQTIFMEILGLEQVFEKDVQAAVEEFNISDCDARFFGMTYEELTETMGEPTSEQRLDGGIRSLNYDSKNYKYSVNFKIYPEQGDVCSAVSVNWFY